MTKSSGSDLLHEAPLNETEADVEKGWADGPWTLQQLEFGASVSRRFALQQEDNMRMIDDFFISGVNDSCTINTKLDFHVVDTFVAFVKAYSQAMDAAGRDPGLVAKTYDRKSAYRQVDVPQSHLKFAYFSVWR